MQNALSRLLRRGKKEKAKLTARAEEPVYNPSNLASASQITTDGDPVEPQAPEKERKARVEFIRDGTSSNVRNPDAPFTNRATHEGNGEGAENEPSSSPPNTLLSTRSGVDFKKPKYDPAKQKEMLDMGIKTIGLCQAVADIVAPKYIATALQKVAELLGVIKKMVENKEAWKDLIRIIDDHQTVFNEQLRRMHKENLVPDPESPLLAPLKRYAEALEGLAAEALHQSGLPSENELRDTAWEKVKAFPVRYLHADLGKEKVQEFSKQLSHAMEQFKLTLELFVGFTVNDIKLNMTTISSAQQANEILGGIEYKLEHSGRNDNIVSRNITPFGGQHSSCLEGTRAEILKEINSWASSADPQPPIYCIGDVAGIGKSTVAKTLSTQWYEDSQSTVMFFFSQEGSAVRAASDFCFSVAGQIEELYSTPELTAHWKSLAKRRKNLASREITEQWQQLVHQPLSMLGRKGICFLVIDALDECTLATRGPLLRCLLKTFSTGALPSVRVLLTTRNEPDLQEILQSDDYKAFIGRRTLPRSFKGIGGDDVAYYIDYRLKQMPDFQFSAAEKAQLIIRSDGLFIFASLACDLLKQAYTKKEPLKEILLLDRFFVPSHVYS